MESLEPNENIDLIQNLVKNLMPLFNFEQIKQYNSLGWTLLHYACFCRDLKITKQILKKLSVENNIDNMYTYILSHNSFGCTPLHYACYGGCLEIVKELLKYLCHGVLDIQTPYGETLLYCACWNKYPDMMKLLILNGESIINYPKYNAFMKSIKWSKYEHKNVMHIQTRKNMQMVFMVYKHEMLEKN